MTALKELIEIGLSKRDAKSVLRSGQMYAKEIKRGNDRRNNILNTDPKLPEPF